MNAVAGMRSIFRARAAAVAAAVWCIFIAGVAQGQADDARVLAHGNGESFWVARVYADPQRAGGFVTDLYARAAGQARWQQVSRVEGRTVQVAHRGAQVALLQDSGDWLLVSGETTASGRPAPPGMRLISLAPWGDTLVALARVQQAGAAGTQPAPIDADATPASDLMLLTLTPTGWVESGLLGAAALRSDGASDASLAVIEGVPTVAVGEGANSVRIYRPSSFGAGRATAIVERPNPIATFKLLGGGPVAVLWTVETDGAATLHWLTSTGMKPVAVDVGAPGRRMSAAYAIERVRVVYQDGLVLSERTYDPLTGAPSGAGKILLPRPTMGSQVWQWLQSLLPVLLLFTIISSLRRRREMQETMQAADPLPLAPFGRRLLAGTIDSVPVIAAAVLLVVWEKRAELAGEPFFTARSQVALLAGLAAYLLHTAVSEVAFGRTIGKVVCGLRVVGLQGERPTVGALLTRNVLRLIDLSMMFFPLVLVLYSPLRQRAGDVAAGTLVVLNKPRTEPALAEAEPASPPAKDENAGRVEVTEKRAR